MKSVLTTLILVAVIAVPAMAASGNLSNEMLSKMGLSSMKVMTDNEGTAVRGMGFATVYGRNTARLLGSTSTSSYRASGENLAFGGSGSSVVITFNGFVIAWTAAYGGGIAVAH